MSKVIVIAEAGVNHNGDFDLAKELIRAAANAQADYVKFQTFKADRLVSKQSKKAAYQIANMVDGDDTQYGMLKKLELPEAWHFDLKQFAEQCGIKFLSTGFDIESIDFLDRLGIDYFKVPSGEITNKPYLQHIASKGKPVILSTGMSTLNEVKSALHVIEESGQPKSKCTVLHCNTEYPTPFSDVNLRAMVTIKNQLEVEIGYSDHTLGIEVPIAAVALGARIIEKHFTIDRNLPGPDHKASLEPFELTAMMRSIRNTELALSGSGLKEPSASEIKNLYLGRKSLHYKMDFKKGHRIQMDDLLIVRPGDGISPMEINRVVGKILRNSVTANTKVFDTDLM